MFWGQKIKSKCYKLNVERAFVLGVAFWNVSFLNPMNVAPVVNCFRRTQKNIIFLLEIMTQYKAKIYFIFHDS